MSDSLTVRALTPKDGPAWDAYVRAHPDSTLYHTLAWRDVVQDVFGHRPHYLVAQRGGAVVGLLPLFIVRLPILGSKALSLPYDVGSGGPLADSDDEAVALVNAARAVAREEGVSYLELRCDGPRAPLDQAGLVRSEPVLISDMALDTDASVWARVRKDHIKAMRKAETRNVKVTLAETVREYLEFYDVYLRVFRDFGTPPYGARYFTTLFERLHAQGSVRLLLARVDGRAVGGLLFFCGGQVLVSKFAACLEEAVPLRAYAALYGEAIRVALPLGYRRLSWGTSSRAQTGLVDFKEGWGAETRAAAVYQEAIRGSAPSIERYYDADGLAQRAWRHLPLTATRILGPPLNRWFC